MSLTRSHSLSSTLHDNDGARATKSSSPSAMEKAPASPPPSPQDGAGTEAKPVVVKFEEGDRTPALPFLPGDV